MPAPPPPGPPSPSLKGMEKGIPPRSKTKPSSKSRAKRKSHYSKTAHMYSNKPLPPLPKPSDSSRAASRDGSAGKMADAHDLTRPKPLNIPRRPKVTLVQGAEIGAAPPPQRNLPSSSVKSTAQTHAQPRVPPRHPARPSPHPQRMNSFNSRPAPAGRRSNSKVMQLTGCDVDIYDDVRERFSSFTPSSRPADALFDHYVSKLEELPLVEETQTSEPGSPTTPFPVHGYEPFVGSSEFGSDGTASAAGSRHGSTRFSFSSRPSWSSHSLRLSFEGKALSSGSRESFSDNDAAIDYHRFASELAGSLNHPSGESRRLSGQSNGHTRQKSSSSLQNGKRASSQSVNLAELGQQRSSTQLNKAPPASVSAPPAPSAPAVPPQRLPSSRRKKTASASFSSKPWTAEEARKWNEENNELLPAHGLPGSTPAPASAPAPARAPTRVPARAPAPAATAAPVAASAPTAEPEPHSVFESDSDEPEEEEVGIKISIKGFLRRRMSTQQDIVPAIKPQRLSSKDDLEKRIIEKTRERRSQRRSKEQRRPREEQRPPTEDLSKWFRDSPTRHILS